ncbi:MAG TPA: ATP-binding protein [Gaiellaceae bacterium]|nr:ATP-binding protein [Gaiellaceae bacterium]
MSDFRDPRDPTALSRALLPSAVELNPVKFYALIDLATPASNAASKKERAVLDQMISAMDALCDQIDRDVDNLAQINNNLLSEVRQTTRRKHNPFKTAQETEDDFTDLRHTASGRTFMHVIFNVASVIRMAYHELKDVAESLRPPKFLLVGKRVPEALETIEQLQAFSVQFEMNRAALNRYTEGVFRAEKVKTLVVNAGRRIVELLDEYYGALLHRHTVDGVKVHVDPVTTDIAISIYENVDSSGEIADGKKPDEVSAYSIRKASIVADAIKKGLVGEFIKTPARLLEFIKTHLVALWQTGEQLAAAVGPGAERLRTLLGSEAKKSWQIHARELLGEAEFQQALIFLDDLNPQRITAKDKTGLLTAEERFEMEFKNATIAQVAKRLHDSTCSTQDLIEHILARKHELHVYYQDVNSFYVCKLGNGNPFTGEAPGALTVVPGSKPVVDMNDVVGAGFDQVRTFVEQIRKSARWHDLYLATSPSKSADKANALLIGPQGCGKSEVLRAVGGDKKSIGIYAQPSDFLTCWKGEAEKNPKRLFEEALRIQKESKKQVFILIDEVDTILNDDHARGGFGATNLTTEFQQLMDGILQYPHIAVWAATNHPERIPMPMIRRFSKVAIVGELDQADRVKLLKHFVGFLPIADDFSDQAWADAAERLDGAVGDTIRKVADYVWREKMTYLVDHHPDLAEQLVRFLNEREQFDLSRFDSGRRKTLHGKIRDRVAVRPKDVLDSVEIHLGNVAIRSEIQTAKETYARSKMFLAGINARGSRLAPIEDRPQ